MKKILFFIALIGLSVITHAQLGVKAGINISSWTGSDADGAKSLTGFHGGAYYIVAINKNFSFQPEATFSAEGAKDDASATKIKTNFINITPMFRYNSAGLFVGTGPQLGLLMSAKATDGSTSIDVKNSFKGSDFSWAFGAGYDMSNGLGIEARYNLGLSSIAKESGTDVKTSVFQIGLRYNFKMGGSTEKK